MITRYYLVFLSILFWSCNQSTEDSLKLQYVIQSIDVDQEKMNVEMKLINTSSRPLVNNFWELHWNQMKGKIIDVLEKGYKLGDKIIRFPKVVIGQ